MKVLAVLRTQERMDAVRTRFETYYEALEFQTAESGLFALTTLERDTPDLIISEGDLGDMSGLDFLEIVRDDEALKDIAFILLDEHALESFSPAQLEIVLEQNAQPAVILAAATSLLARDTRSYTLSQPLYGEVEQPRFYGAKMRGSFEILSLFDLVLSLTQKANSGQLYLLLGRTEAALYFARGKFVHAEIGPYVGEGAVFRIFDAVEHTKHAEFYYEPSLSPLPEEAFTLRAPVQDLLLKVAIELDQQALTES